MPENMSNVERGEKEAAVSPDVQERPVSGRLDTDEVERLYIEVEAQL